MNESAETVSTVSSLTLLKVLPSDRALSHLAWDPTIILAREFEIDAYLL